MQRKERKKLNNEYDDSMEVVGVEGVNFTAKDGTEISGVSVYYTEHLDPDRGDGLFAGKLFFSAAKLAALNYSPAVGQVIQVLYDRFGKVKRVAVVDSLIAP